MNFKLDLRLSSLRCNQPDEDEEEPYLWTFFFQLDGSTVRQPQPNDFRLVGNIKIAAGDGGHGNLSSSTAIAGQVLQIPESVGSHHATLRPLRLKVLNQTVVIPGRLLAFVVLMDEDATADVSILKAHDAVRDFLESRWNEFISNQLNQTAVVAEVSLVQAANPALTGSPLFLAAVESLIDKFVEGLEAPATRVVKDAVIEDSNIFELVINFFDSDDTMGAQRLTFSERQIIDAGFQIPIHTAIIRTEEGQWTAHHELFGNLQATLTADESDLVSQSARGTSSPLGRGEHVFNVPLVCVVPGTRVQWTLSGINWEEDIRFLYPFLAVRWSIEGSILVALAGTVTFSASCGFPKFDPSQPPRLSSSTRTQKTVQVRYEIQDQGNNGKLLKLSNQPGDGNYSFIASAVGLAGNGRVIPLGSKMVTFTGQAISLEPNDFAPGYNKCLDEFDRRFAKSRTVGVKDLWDPHARYQAYDHLIHVVDDMAAVRGLAPGQVKVLKDSIAQKLQVKVKL